MQRNLITESLILFPRTDGGWVKRLEEEEEEEGVEERCRTSIQYPGVLEVYQGCAGLGRVRREAQQVIYTSIYLIIYLFVSKSISLTLIKSIVSISLTRFLHFDIKHGNTHGYMKIITCHPYQISS